MELYERITQNEPVTENDAVRLAELRAWGLIDYDPASPTTPVAMPPRDAGWRMLHAGLQDLAARAAQMAVVPAAADQLNQAFERGKWSAGSGSEFLSEPAAVNARIQDALGQAREELLAAQPGGPRGRENMNIALERDSAALARGVSIRTLYRDTVRDDALTSEWATTMAGRGAHFRTLASPFERVIIVDRKVAVISNYVVPYAPDHAAWIVTDRAMVAFLAQVFEAEWRRADIWHGERRTRKADAGAAGARTSRLQREIMRALSAGEVQEAAAKHLGISKRSLQRELEGLRTVWKTSTTSIGELTYHWALSPDRQIDDQAVEQAA
ncbi:TrmB family transcriptional regulator [Streptomyces sp. NPDC088348]|uniref:TrmB family transcriptional regulator n=1 Tax=Streptomyces sp. NPDC088348 TaxID=3365853 RepID=UPI0038287642